MLKAEIYTTESCQYNVRIKSILDRRSIHYEEFFIGNHLTRDDFYCKFENAKTVPQIILDGKYIGGFEALCYELKETP